MATAVRFVARKICNRAVDRLLQPRFSAVVKEGQRKLLLSHGGSSIRRFSSSEPPNMLNSNKLSQHLPSEAKSGLSKRIDEKKHELLHLLRQMEGESSMVNDQKELQHLLRRYNNRVLATLYDKVTGGAILAGGVTALVVSEFVFRMQEN